MKLKFKEISFLELGLNKNIRTGAGFNSSDFIDEGIPLIKIGNIKNNVIDLNDCSFVSAKYKTDAVVKEKDLLIAMRGATSGKLGLVSKESEGYYYVGSIGNLGPINEKLIYFPFLKYLEEQLFEILKTKSKGTATPMVSIGMLKEFKLLIPESKDQQKYLYDVLELRKDKSNLIRKELTHQLSLIKQMRQAFLREAMQGRFEFPQQPLTEALEGNGLQTGQHLLTKIKAEKSQLIADKKLKKEKELSPISENEIPFEIPEHWAWCRLGEIISHTENLDIHKKLSSETIINYVDIASIDNKNYLIKEVKKSTVEELSTRARRVLKKDYIIYSTVRPYLKNIAIVENELPNFIGSTGFNVFKPINSNIKYLFYFLLNPDLNKMYEEMMVGFNSPSITNEQFENTLFPLPPLHEQEQIVAKLEELMAFCDGLEQSIKESQGYNEMLLQQVTPQVNIGKLGLMGF